MTHSIRSVKSTTHPLWKWKIGGNCILGSYPPQHMRNSNSHCINSLKRRKRKRKKSSHCNLLPLNYTCTLVFDSSFLLEASICTSNCFGVLYWADIWPLLIRLSIWLMSKRINVWKESKTPLFQLAQVLAQVPPHASWTGRELLSRSELRNSPPSSEHLLGARANVLCEDTS